MGKILKFKNSSETNQTLMKPTEEFHQWTYNVNGIHCRIRQFNDENGIFTVAFLDPSTGNWFDSANIIVLRTFQSAYECLIHIANDSNNPSFSSFWKGPDNE